MALTMIWLMMILTSFFAKRLNNEEVRDAMHDIIGDYEKLLVEHVMEPLKKQKPEISDMQESLRKSFEKMRDIFKTPEK